MPSIETLIADLENRSIVGVGAKPDSNSTNLSSIISQSCRMKYLFVHMKASISAGNRLTCESAATSAVFNGSYLHFQDDWATVANLDINRPIVASGNFSGCQYVIYRSEQDSLFKCVHIARPSGVDSDAIVTLTDSYAKQKKWEQIRSIGTRGKIGVAGCKEVYLVSRLTHNRRIETVLLCIDNQGRTVDTESYTDAI